MNTFKESWFERGYRNGERDSQKKLVNPDYFDPDLMWTHYPKRSEIVAEIEDNSENILKCGDKEFLQKFNCEKDKSEFVKNGKDSWTEGYTQGIADVFGYWGTEEY